MKIDKVKLATKILTWVCGIFLILVIIIGLIRLALKMGTGIGGVS